MFRGSEYEQLLPCIGINLVDFVLFPEDELFHHFYTLREYDRPDEELTRDLSVHYLELPKILDQIRGVSGDAADHLKLLEKWLYLMKEIDNPEDPMVQKIIRTTPELEKVQQEYDLFLTDEQLRWEALSHEMWLHDQASYRKEARDEGLAEGKAEGLAEGKAEGLAEGLAEGKAEGLAEGLNAAKYDIARKMKTKGFGTAEIAEMTGLTEAEIEAI